MNFVPVCRTCLPWVLRVSQIGSGLPGLSCGVFLSMCVCVNFNSYIWLIEKMVILVSVYIMCIYVSLLVLIFNDAVLNSVTY